MPVGIGTMMVLNVVMQLVNGIASRSSSAKSQEKQFEFQRETQAHQWERSKALQLELRELNAQETRDNQQRAAQNQKDIVELQYELNHWPLSVSPAVLRNQMESYINEGREAPLHIIVSSSGSLKGSVLNLSGVIKDGMRETFSLMGQHYSRNGKTPVVMYTNADSQKELGPEQVDTIYAVLPGAPTVVLMPQCQDTEFVLKCSYWGVGDVIRPEHLEIFRCDLKKMQTSLLRQFGASWPEDQKRLGLPADAKKDELYSLIVKEREALETALKNGASERDIDIYITPKYDAEYAKKEIVSTFQHAITQNAGYVLNSACKTIVTLLADSHYLLASNQQPKLPSICRDILETEPELLAMSQSVFAQLMEKCGDPLSKPLMHARLSCAYSEGKFLPYAEQERQASINSLKEVIPHPENGEWLIVDDLRHSVQELNEVEVKNAFFKQCSEVLNADELNKEAVVLYKKGEREKAIALWNKALKRGSAKATLNLGLISYLPKRDWESLWRCFLHAHNKGVNLAQQVAQVAQLCRAGYWASSFTFLLPALGHTEATKRGIAVSYTCLLMLTNLRDELSGSALKTWCISACQALGLSRTPCPEEYPQLALMWLQKEHENGSKEAYKALLAIGNRLWWDKKSPLFGADSVDDKYTLSPEERLWPTPDRLKDAREYFSSLRAGF